MRRGKALADLMSGGDFSEGRKGFSISTESKVRAAVTERLQAKERSWKTDEPWMIDSADEPAGPSRSSPGGRPSSTTSRRSGRPGSAGSRSGGRAGELDLEALIEKRRALLSANFEDEAHKLDAIIKNAQLDAERERADLEQRLFKQHVAATEASQREQVEQLRAAQASEISRVQIEWSEELTAVSENQAKEIQDFELRITRAAVEEVELPRDLLKYRFKPTTKLQTLRKALAGLPKVAESKLRAPRARCRRARCSRTLLAHPARARRSRTPLTRAARALPSSLISHLSSTRACRNACVL